MFPFRRGARLGARWRRCRRRRSVACPFFEAPRHACRREADAERSSTSTSSSTTATAIRSSAAWSRRHRQGGWRHLRFHRFDTRFPLLVRASPRGRESAATRSRRRSQRGETLRRASLDGSAASADPELDPAVADAKKNPKGDLSARCAAPRPRISRPRRPRARRDVRRRKEERTLVFNPEPMTLVTGSDAARADHPGGDPFRLNHPHRGRPAGA